MTSVFPLGLAMAVLSSRTEGAPAIETFEHLATALILMEGGIASDASVVELGGVFREHFADVAEMRAAWTRIVDGFGSAGA